MIYLPKRALFIHIPRAAGNSISSAIAQSCVGKNFDILICNTPNQLCGNWTHIFQTHALAKILKPHIIDWDEIFKFAIFRDEEERLNSTKRLVQRDIDQKTYENAMCDEGWREVLTSEKRREDFYKNQRKLDLDYYTKGTAGEDLGVETFDYNNLNDLWPEICAKCMISFHPLPHYNRS